MTIKLCECGCGNPAPIAKKTHRPRGYIKGQPTRFIVGHGGPRTGRPSVPLADRFWDRVDVGPADACWPWTGPTFGMGYGHVAVRKDSRSTHRVAYELANGPIPTGMHVRHTCDNPPCCNPAHLLLGTPADNMRDRDERKRLPVGSQCSIARLLEDDIPRVFDLRAQGMTTRAIGREFGVSGSTISAVLNRKTWKHVEVAA